MDKLVEELRALLDSGVTQLEVAREAGVSPPTISRFLRGLNCPSYFRAMQIRRAVDALAQTARETSGAAVAEPCAEAGR